MSCRIRHPVNYQKQVREAPAFDKCCLLDMFIISSSRDSVMVYAVFKKYKLPVDKIFGIL